ncbi:SDR family oxidoreductase [Extensimonas sp. H3M7-6]|uniref:SDR family oxidoreductase n=1 Tax=Extensimonas soli TaxID=3031322 RepID=UPI0023D99C97|nr:SDR family oxidoreductase [Extensimonas sp. H3M7-6]MDF1482264.1 SDR family oxidoreductase [Extensimonas sp. H3M7-6]
MSEPTKVAIVTAASQGMGAACARALAAQGYRLVLMSRSAGATALAKQLGGVGLQGSVTDPADLEKLVALAMNEYGRVDAVVNNTGHAASGDLLALSDADWHAALDLLLLNVVRMARLVTPIFERQGQGAMVNISTYGAHEPTPAYPLSSAIRAALSNFTKMYATRYAAANIRMNNVLPGFIDSFPIGDAVRAMIPMARAGRVEEIATTVAFLLSPGGGYITGQNILVEGGLAKSN